MKIQPMIINYNNVSYKQKLSSNVQKQSSEFKNIAYMVSSVGVLTMLITAVGLSSKGNFDKNILKKGLILKNGLLVDKQSGKNFTGKIKSNIGSIGFNKIETQHFVDGVITEKTYKNALGQELNGWFYKDGKECMQVKINYPYFTPWNKSVSSYWYNEAHTELQHADSKNFKGSVFDWARKIIKEKGWFKK